MLGESFSNYCLNTHIFNKIILILQGRFWNETTVNFFLYEDKYTRKNTKKIIIAVCVTYTKQE